MSHSFAPIKWIWLPSLDNDQNGDQKEGNLISPPFVTIEIFQSPHSRLTKKISHPQRWAIEKNTVTIQLSQFLRWRLKVFSDQKKGHAKTFQ